MHNEISYLNISVKIFLSTFKIFSKKVLFLSDSEKFVKCLKICKQFINNDAELNKCFKNFFLQKI